MQKHTELTGLTSPEIEHETDEQRPLAMYWMTDELLDKTVHVWSKIYGRIISRKEAVEILRNMKNFYEFLCTIVE
jgi:hypothetical protein